MTKSANQGPTPIKISKDANDPICLRASIGGREGEGYYLLYRGDEHEVIACIEAVLAAMKHSVQVGALGRGRN